MKIRQNVPLKDVLFYEIGGKARWLLDASSSEDIIEAVEFIQTNKIDKYIIVGLGSNLLMPDEDFSGVVIRIRKTGTPDIRMTHDGLLVSYAGQTLDDLIQFSFENNIRGLEVLGGLPSTVGGAIRGNAGAFGVEMKDVLVKVGVLKISDDGYEVIELTRDECQFGYRDSIFKHNAQYIVLKGFFQLEHATDEEIKNSQEVYKKQVEYRKSNHPVEYPSCGSVFKNVREPNEVEKIISVWPEIEELVKIKWHGKVSMGYITKRLGFSGYQVGGAKITEKHANYISNVDNATAKDVKQIIADISKKFEETFGFPPHLEAEIISFS